MHSMCVIFWLVSPQIPFEHVLQELLTSTASGRDWRSSSSVSTEIYDIKPLNAHYNHAHKLSLKLNTITYMSTTGLTIALGSKVIGVQRDEIDKRLFMKAMKCDGCLKNATNLKHFCGNVLRGMVMVIKVYIRLHHLWYLVLCTLFVKGLTRF